MNEYIKINPIGGGDFIPTSEKGAPNGVAPLDGSSKILSADLPVTTVIPNSYTNTDITVDATGRITAASNGSGGISWPLTATDYLDMDDNFIYLGNSHETWVKYSSDHGALIAQTTPANLDFVTAGGFNLYSNSAIDGSGPWEPFISFGGGTPGSFDGNVLIRNVDSGFVGYVSIEMNSGLDSNPGIYDITRFSRYPDAVQIAIGYKANGSIVTSNIIRSKTDLPLTLGMNTSDSAQFDESATAGTTRMLLWDVDSGILQRVKVTANNAVLGVTGRVLYIDNI